MPIMTPSTRPVFDAFAQYYVQEIEPFLNEKEAGRQRTVRLVVMIGAMGFIAAGAVFLLKPFGEVSFFAGGIVGLVAVVVAAIILAQARKSIGLRLMQLICTGLGLRYRHELQRPAYCEVFRDTGLLPSFDDEKWEDEVEGEHAGVGFILCEAHLEDETVDSEGDRESRTVFHGQLIVIDYPKSFLGVTVLKRDAGLFNRLTKPGRTFSRVALVSAAFEEAFEAWSTDQVEARDLLDPVVLERFEELERLYGGKQLRAAFVEGKLHIAVETGNRLDMGTMFAPLNQPLRVEKILKEFDLIFDLIDVAAKKTDRPLDGPLSLDQIR